LGFEASLGKIGLETLYQKTNKQKTNPSQKRAGVVQDADPEFKPQYHKKKKKAPGFCSRQVFCQVGVKSTMKLV
jgi:hypothetical protein